MENLVIADNRADLSGGGLYALQASPVLRDCLFTDNLAASGGGLACSGAEALPLLERCRLLGNRAEGSGGGLRADASARPLLTGCLLGGNTAPDGGGIYAAAGGSPELLACRLEANSATYGGGAYFVNTGGGKLSRCRLLGNVAAEEGGGIRSLESGVRAEGTVFQGNSALRGGALWSAGLPAPGLAACTLTGNQAAAAGGALCVEGESAPQFRGSILWGNAPEEIWSPFAPVSVCWSDVAGGFPGEGNIDLDPLLEGTDPWRPLPGSPCIDSGTSEGVSAVDFAGYGRGDDPPTPDSGAGPVGWYDRGASEFRRDPLAAELSCVPDSGTLPFLCRLSAGAANPSPIGARTFAAAIDLRLPGGALLAGWRQQVLTLTPGEGFLTRWRLAVPARPFMVGEAVLRLTVADVTPAPWNQPPYPPSGETDSSSCTVVGLWP